MWLEEVGVSSEGCLLPFLYRLADYHGLICAVQVTYIKVTIREYYLRYLKSPGYFDAATCYAGVACSGRKHSQANIARGWK